MGQIKEYYSGKNILLTGATGLMGKVLMEKILTDLPEIQRLYVLIRPKKLQDGTQLTADSRLWSEILQSSAFQELRLAQKEKFEEWIRSKVEAVPGDLSVERLGLDPRTGERLQNEVDLIINCAAVVSFDAPLDEALTLNTLGPKRIVEFARLSQKIQISHVSTSFVNGMAEGPIPEEPIKLDTKSNPRNLYPLNVTNEIDLISEAISNVESKSRGFIRRSIFKFQAFSKRITNPLHTKENIKKQTEELRLKWKETQLVNLGTSWARSKGWTDTYTFTKAMGEQIILDEKGDIPTVIFRPAIIEAGLKRPQPGWLDGFRMLDPLIVAYGRGALPNFPGNPHTILDIVPADLVINAVLAVTASRPPVSSNPIYHIATGMENPISLQGFTQLVEEYFRRETLSNRGTVNTDLPQVTFPSRKSFLRKVQIYLKFIRLINLLSKPFSLFPLIRRIEIRTQTRYQNLKRLEYYLRIYGPYSEVRCQYLTNRLREVWNSLDKDDQILCDFDVTQIDWRKYVQDIYIPGLKHFILGVPLLRPASLQQESDSFQKPPNIPASTKELQKFMLKPASKEELSHWTGNKFPKSLTRKVTRTVLKLIFRFYLGFNCKGLENIPKSEPFIIVTNHSSHLDTGAILVALGSKASQLKPLAAQDYFFRNRIWSWTFDFFAGAVPLDRRSHSGEGLGLAAGLLQENHSILMFPEGGRSATGKIQSFKGGIGLLAISSRAPIVPAHIRGTYYAMPKGNSIIRPRSIEVSIGTPIRAENYINSGTDEGLHELSRRITVDIQKAVEALN